MGMCCMKLFAPGAARQMNSANHMAKNPYGPSGSPFGASGSPFGASGSPFGAAGAPGGQQRQAAPAQSRGGGGFFGGGLLGAMGGNAMAQGIMNQVSAGLKEAADRARKAALEQFVSGPKLLPDGTLQQTWNQELWAFSPAYPLCLKGTMSEEQYWKVIERLNHITYAAAAASGGAGAATSHLNQTAAQLEAGNVHGMSNPANVQNMVASAQKVSSAREFAMEQVQSLLFDINREVEDHIWNCERIEYTTQSYVHGHNGAPGHNTTQRHVKWDLTLKYHTGASAFAEGAGRLASLRGPLPPGLVLPPGVTPEELGAAVGPPPGAAAPGGTPGAPGAPGAMAPAQYPRSHEM